LASLTPKILNTDLMNIESIRDNTPGCKNVIHFNNAGSSLVTSTTLNTQIDYLKKESMNGGYETAAKNKEQLNAFYTETARLIGAEPDEIAYTESATVAWERAFFSINFSPNDEILCDSTTYASSYIAYKQAEERFGTKTVVVPANNYGELDLDALKKLINGNTKLISITHMPSHNGLVNPAEEIGKIAKDNNIIYLLDACQSVGQYPIDVRNIQCDFLSTTGRKFLRGPRGTGFLFASKRRMEEFTPLSLDLHSAEWTSENEISIKKDAKKFETWESNLANKMGLTSAVKQLNTLGIDLVWNRVTSLADYFREELGKIDQIVLQDVGRIKGGIITLSFKTHLPEQIKGELTKQGFNTTVAVKSVSFWDMESRNLDAVLRISVHYYNTKEEIDSFAGSIRQILS
jgi:cysteine desulfurase/selenocysteine lyase